MSSVKCNGRPVHHDAVIVSLFIKCALCVHPRTCARPARTRTDASPLMAATVYQLYTIKRNRGGALAFPGLFSVH